MECKDDKESGSKKEDTSKVQKFVPRHTSGILCCVKTCRRSRRRDRNIKLFKFPKESTIMGKEWRRRCKIDASSPKNFFICDRHFLKSEIGAKFLHNHVIPSVNLPDFDAETDSDKNPDKTVILETDQKADSNNCSTAPVGILSDKSQNDQVILKGPGLLPIQAPCENCASANNNILILEKAILKQNKQIMKQNDTIIQLTYENGILRAQINSGLSEYMRPIIFPLKDINDVQYFNSLINQYSKESYISRVRNLLCGEPQKNLENVLTREVCIDLYMQNASLKNYTYVYDVLISAFKNGSNDAEKDLLDCLCYTSCKNEEF